MAPLHLAFFGVDALLPLALTAVRSRPLRPPGRRWSAGAWRGRAWAWPSRRLK